MPRPLSRLILGLGLLGVAVAHAAEPAAPRFVHGAALAPPLVGDLYLPVGSPAKLGVLVLGGAEGGVPSGAKFLASKGYAALALAYFGAPGLPETLEQIPLEYLDRALAWLDASPGVPRGGVVIQGGSKGAELALLLASRHADVIGVIAICCKQELLLAVVGGVFVLEAVSVILQVLSFRLTGKRIFLMSPIHHHFELSGWKENTVIVRFWILSAIFALLGLATLKLR